MTDRNLSYQTSAVWKLFEELFPDQKMRLSDDPNIFVLISGTGRNLYDLVERLNSLYVEASKDGTIKGFIKSMFGSKQRNAGSAFTQGVARDPAYNPGEGAASTNAVFVYSKNLDLLTERQVDFFCDSVRQKKDELSKLLKFDLGFAMESEALLGEIKVTKKPFTEIIKKPGAQRMPPDFNS